jgi:hypothetical protein
MGLSANSYFIKASGNCPTNIKTQKECEEKGLLWIEPPKYLPVEFEVIQNKFISGLQNIPGLGSKFAPSKPEDKPQGACFKPRFAYMNNVPKGFLNFRGLGPSSINDVLSIAPDKLLSVLSGKTVDGTGVLPCPIGPDSPDSKETFQNNPPKKSGYQKKVLFFVFILMVLYVGWKIYNR